MIVCLFVYLFIHLFACDILGFRIPSEWLNSLKRISRAQKLTVYVWCCSDVAEREPLEVNDAIYIETTNHCDDVSYLNGDFFCPASPTTVPVFKSRSNSGNFRISNRPWRVPEQEWIFL